MGKAYVLSLIAFILSILGLLPFIGGLFYSLSLSLPTSSLLYRLLELLETPLLLLGLLNLFFILETIIIIIGILALIRYRKEKVVRGKILAKISIIIAILLLGLSFYAFFCPSFNPSIAYHDFCSLGPGFACYDLSVDHVSQEISLVLSNGVGYDLRDVYLRLYNSTMDCDGTFSPDSTVLVDGRSLAFTMKCRSEQLQSGKEWVSVCPLKKEIRRLIGDLELTYSFYDMYKNETSLQKKTGDLVAAVR